MSLTAALWENRDELVRSFHHAAIAGILAAWRRCEHLGTVPQEPDFVAGLAIESTRLIISALRSVLAQRGISVSVFSVFSHQTPQVTFVSHPTASCELGDILFAYVHTPKVGQPRRNAVLFQAKLSAKQPHRVVAGERDQLRLYTDWPDFVYSKTRLLTGQKRSVTPKAPHAGAQYLMIDCRSPDDPLSGLLGFPGTYPVGCCMPDKYLRHHSALASELFNLLIFRTGRPFEDKSTASMKHDWSQVVWDLLETGMKKSFDRKNSGRRASPRFIGDSLETLDGIGVASASSLVSYTTAQEILGRESARALYTQRDDPPPGEFDGERGSDEPDGGVSVVLIETSERQSEG